MPNFHRHHCNKPLAKGGKKQNRKLSFKNAKHKVEGFAAVAFSSATSMAERKMNIFQRRIFVCTFSSTLNQYNLCCHST
jgi:hypothetical protein